MERLRTWTSRCTLLVASVLLGSSAVLVYQVTLPHFGPGTVEFSGQLAQPFTQPFLQQKVPKAKFILKEHLELSSWHPVIFSFYPQDVLWSIKVNGHDVPAPGLPLSVAHHEGRSINLAPYLHPGSNEIEVAMEVYWGEASLNIYVSPWDKWSLLIAAFILFGTLAAGAFFFSLFRIKIDAAEAVILSGDFLLRYVYVSGTPYFVRAYDWWGHVAYLDHVTQHLSLPDASSDWESYQPPLYYYLVGCVTRWLLIGGMPETQRFILWQAFSLACSTGILLAGFWIGKLLYEKKPKYRLYLLAVLGVAPALVFNASRISNDVLLNLLEFLSLGFLLHFWKQPNWRSWLGLSLVLGLALLTKASALILIPISLLCLGFAPHLQAKTKALQAAGLLLIALGMAGWYYLPRAFQESGVDSYFVGNIHHLNPKGHIDGVLAKSLVFNPFKVVRYPFVEPWGPRHEYFLEYFFKSIFLGEWLLGHAYRWIARAFILTALVLIPVFLRGIWLSVRDRTGNDFPLLITFFAVFSAQWAFVQIAPFMSSQDFRYSVILLVPLVYFFIGGASSLRANGKKMAFLGLQMLALNSAIYLIEVAMAG